MKNIIEIDYEQYEDITNFTYENGLLIFEGKQTKNDLTEKGDGKRRVIITNKKFIYRKIK